MKKLIPLLCFLCLFLPLAIRPAFAGIEDTGIDTANGELTTTNPKLRTVNVSATVEDHIPPSIPILVAPPDQSTLTTILPTFIWKPSTDEQGIGYYQLYLDGNLLFTNIPSGNTTNSDYTLVVEDGEMKLTPKNGLGQGDHSWYIKVYDNNTNSAVSATWHFTIDTLAPLTVVTSVGTVNTSISSADAGSVPTSPIHLSDNQPAISGSSETGATLTLQVDIPSQPSQVFTQTLSNSLFTFQLGVLPVDTIIHFTIVSTDSLGNTSTISDVPFLIESAVIVIPPGETPSPTPVGQTPAPGETPAPTPITIEVPRPEEVINQLQQPPEENRPSFIQQALENLPLLNQVIQNPVTQLVSEVIPIATVLTPIALTVVTATQTSSSLLYPLIDLLIKFLQAIGLLPKRKAHGVVYDSENGKSIAFATINIIGKGAAEFIDSVVSDEHGIFNSIRLAVGTYRLDVIHNDYLFPTKKNRNPITNMFDFYRGEEFAIKDESSETFFIIPLDPKDTTTKQDVRQLRRRYWHSFLLSLQRLTNNLFYPLAALSFTITLFFPTILNIVISILYMILIIAYIMKLRKEPPLTGRVLDDQQHPLAGTVVRVMRQQTNELVGIRVTDADGRFFIRLPKGGYGITYTQNGFIPLENGQPIDIQYVTHQHNEHLNVMMTAVTNL